MESKDTLHQINACLDEILDLPEHEWPDYLANLEAQQPQIAKTVRDMLKAQLPLSMAVDQANQVFESIDSQQDWEDLVAGRKIGHYKIIEAIGQGGMGAVFLANRDDDIALKLALKVVRPELAGSSVIDRFYKERRILASLVHPHISRIYDGGCTPDGLPWFAMEYVKGDHIDDYCNQHQLNIAKRVQLFIKVCEAVSFAHKNLVIHRDLKPPNILVDHRGNPKLLDFGIAGLVDSETGMQQTMTHTNNKMMTPQFASPEQIRGDLLNAATDIYSLGVILYRLLSGFGPYHPKHNNSVTLLSAVLSEDPRPPSAHWATSAFDQNQQKRAAERHTEARKISNILKGDLDNIILKAMEKEPARRYTSVEAMAEDLKRYLNGLTVSARSATIRYRTRKFVSRNKAWVAVASIFVLTLIFFSGAMWFQQQATKVERDKARMERDRAEQEKHTSEQVIAFVTDIFQYADPRNGKGDISVTEILEKGIESLNTDLEDEPLVKVRMLIVIAVIYTNMGRFEDAEALYEESLALCETLDTAVNHVRTLLSYSVMERLRDDTKKALVLVEEAAEVSQQFEGYDHFKFEIFLQNGLLALGQRESQKALDLIAKALQYRDSVGPILASQALSNYARCHQETGDLEKAAELYDESIELAESELDANDPKVLALYRNKTILLNTMGQFEKSLEITRHLLDQELQIFGPDHPAIAYTMANLAYITMRMGNREEAIERFHETVEKFKATLGDDHVSLGVSLSHQGSNYLELGMLDEAEQSINQSIAIHRKKLGEDHLFVSINIVKLGTIKHARNQLPDAQRFIEQGYQRQVLKLGVDHVDLAYALMPLGHIQQQMGYLQEAENHYRRALELRQETLGEDHENSALSMMHLADISAQKGNVVEARQLIDRAGKVFNTTDHPVYASILGYVLTCEGQNEKGLRLLTDSYNQLKDTPGVKQRFAKARLERVKAQQTPSARQKTGASGSE